MMGSEVWVKFFLCQWWDQSKQVWVSLRGKTKMAEYNMAEFKMAAIIKFSQKWMGLSQIELDWVRVLCKMAEFKMVAIIKLIRLN